MKSTNRARRSAFTLIELLTVIAIIAVLAAIIFPVFGTVRENARRADCMTNMKSLSSSLKQYELDNRKYPDFLFAPAIKSDGNRGCAILPAPSPVGSKPLPGSHLLVATGTDTACTPEQASATGKLGGDYVYDDGSLTGKVFASGGLYPEYAKSYKFFVCPNNHWFQATGDKAFDTAPGTIDYPVTTPKSYYNADTLSKTDPTTLTDRYGDEGGPPALRFYKFDSYDTNPAVIKDGSGAATGKIDIKDYVVRYQRQWMGIVPDAGSITNPTAHQIYQNQLIWREPSEDSVVTLCTHHVTSGKVIVLYLSGTAKTLDLTVLKNKENAALSVGLPATTTDFDAFKMTP